MPQLMVDDLVCLISASGQPSKVGDARVEHHKPADSGSQIASPVLEVSEGTVEFPSDKMEGTTPLTLARGEPKSSPKSKAMERTEASLLGDRKRVVGNTVPSELLLSFQNCHVEAHLEPFIRVISPEGRC